MFGLVHRVKCKLALELITEKGKEVKVVKAFCSSFLKTTITEFEYKLMLVYLSFILTDLYILLRYLYQLRASSTVPSGRRID